MAMAMVGDQDQAAGVVVQDPFPVGLSEHLGGQQLIGRSGCHQTTVQHHHLVTVPGLVEVVG